MATKNAKQTKNAKPAAKKADKKVDVKASAKPVKPVAKAAAKPATKLPAKPVTKPVEKIATEKKTTEKPAPKPPKVAAKPVVVKEAPVEAIEAKPTPKIMSGAPTVKVPKEKKPTKKALAAAAAVAKADADWLQLTNQYKAVKPVPYAMSEDYPPKSVISHKILGLGYVLTSLNNRIEVMFKDGKKTLVTNYKK